MAKTQLKTAKPQMKRASSESGGLQALIRKRPHAIFLTMIALLLVIFFHDAFFSGKVFNVPDNVSSIQYEQGYLEKAKAEGINAFWNPYIFAGMPTWGSSSPGHGLYLHTFLDPLKPMLLLQVYGLAQSIINIFPLPEMFWNIFNYFLLGMFTYFFGLRRKFDPFTAFLVAVSVVFSLYSLNWVMGGHNTKITVFAWLPAVLLLVDRLFEKKSVLTIALLVAALHLTFNSGHVQMIFYNMMAVVLYVLYKLYEGEKPVNTALVGAILLASAAFAFLMLSGPFFSTWEYKDFSIRGAGSGGSGHGPATGGLDYDYATNWSFSLMEIGTFFVPSFAGFGRLTYWGTMPFTDSPIYLGIVVCFLALVGIILQPKNKFSHFWIALGSIALLVSFGRNFGVLYDLFFNHVPFFNNFRIPSMILYLEALCVGMLAGIGLSQVITLARGKNKATEAAVNKKITKAVWIPVGIAGALLLLLLAMGGEMKSTIASSMKTNHPDIYTNYMEKVQQAEQAGQMSQVPDELKNLTPGRIYGMAVNDAIVALVFMVLTGLFVWGFARGSVPLTLMQIGVLLLLVVDWWIVDYKPMHMEANTAQQQSLQKTDVVSFLETDTSLYRILPIASAGGDNYYVGFGIQSVSGYHPAKMKLFDDIRNKIFGEFRVQDAQQINQWNWALLSMLNAKYVTIPKGVPLSQPWLRKVYEGASEDVYQNLAVLPRAFLVGRTEVIPDDSLMFMKIATLPGYEPDRVAYLSAPLSTPLRQQIDSLPGGTATVTSHGINGMTIAVETPVDAVLKIGDTYYPSGWTATIDGVPAEIARCDYAFRAIAVSAGKHTVTLAFEPRTYQAGLLVTVVTNYLLAAVLLFYCVMWARKRFGARQGAAKPDVEE
ncbi:MAG: YfhO family protein [Ignavibacteria bacterium]|nr:YfhO family protein [Ignavibacteria bacterium]